MAVEIFSATELAEIEAYHRPGYIIIGVMSLAGPLIQWALARYAAEPMWRWAERVASDPRFDRWAAAPGLRVLAKVGTQVWRGPGLAAALLFALQLIAILTLIDLPVDVYFGFIRERQYGLSDQSFGAWAIDWLKSNLIWAFGITALTVGLFGLARRLRQWWWVLGLVAAGAMVGSTLLDPYESRIYVDQTPLEAGPLRDQLTALLHRANVEFADILVEKTSVKSVRLQAYFAGAGPTRTIVLNDSLVNALTPEEVTAAMAHEAGHVHEVRWYRHIAASLALIGFLGLVELLFRQVERRQWRGISTRGDIRVLPLILLLFTVLSTLGGPLSGAFSRHNETSADLYALDLLGSHTAFESRLVKAARINKSNPWPPRWVVWLGTSHPPMGDRLATVEAWAQENGR